jgi:hypothetical protein
LAKLIGRLVASQGFATRIQLKWVVCQVVGFGKPRSLM